MHNDYFLNYQKPENENKAVSRSQNTSSSLSAAEQLDAIIWAANQAGVSYGQFTSKLTPERKELIYEEYQEWQKARKAEIRDRMKNRERSTTVEQDDDPPFNYWKTSNRDVKAS